MGRRGGQESADRAKNKIHSSFDELNSFPFMQLRIEDCGKLARNVSLLAIRSACLRCKVFLNCTADTAWQALERPRPERRLVPTLFAIPTSQRCRITDEADLCCRSAVGFEAAK